MLKKRRLSERQIRKKEKQLTALYRHLSSLWDFFETMNIPVIKGSFKTDSNIANTAFMQRYGRRLGAVSTFSLEDLKRIHPEFNFSEADRFYHRL